MNERIRFLTNLFLYVRSASKLYSIGEIRLGYDMNGDCFTVYDKEGYCVFQGR